MNPLDDPAKVIAEYLDECDVEEFVDEGFGASAAKDIIDLLHDAGWELVSKMPAGTE